MKSINLKRAIKIPPDNKIELKPGIHPVETDNYKIPMDHWFIKGLIITKDIELIKEDINGKTIVKTLPALPKLQEIKPKIQPDLLDEMKELNAKVEKMNIPLPGKEQVVLKEEPPADGEGDDLIEVVEEPVEKVKVNKRNKKG
jgi:hypothetical protein